LRKPNISDLAGRLPPDFISAKTDLPQIFQKIIKPACRVRPIFIRIDRGLAYCGKKRYTWAGWMLVERGTRFLSSAAVQLSDANHYSNLVENGKRTQKSWQAISMFM